MAAQDVGALGVLSMHQLYPAAKEPVFIFMKDQSKLNRSTQKL
jgi:hypothetical protein